MVREAHTYLVGAMSGATLIAAAIAVFVVLVTAQVFQNWPIDGLGGSGEDSAAVSGDRTTGSGAGDGAAATGTANGAGGAAAANSGGRAVKHDPNTVSTGAPGSKAFQPGASAPGGEGGAGAGGGDGAAGSPTSQNPAADSAGNGGGAGAGTGGGGGGSAAGGSTSETVTNTVNETVHGVDETVTGGVLEKSGVTGVTEGVVNGVAGPESTVGQVVDGATGAVGGLLHPNR